MCVCAVTCAYFLQFKEEEEGAVDGSGGGGGPGGQEQAWERRNMGHNEENVAQRASEKTASVPGVHPINGSTLC